MYNVTRRVATDHVTTIEHCSNELWLEYFDYLTSFEILYSFSNLNYRLSSIVYSLPIHIDSTCTMSTVSFKQFYSNISRPPQCKHILSSISCKNTVGAISLFQLSCRIEQFYNLSSIKFQLYTHADITDLVQFSLKLDQLPQLSTVIVEMYNLSFDYNIRFGSIIHTMLKLKSLKTLRLPTINEVNFIHLKRSFIEELTLEWCSLDIFYYLNLSLKHLTIKNIISHGKRLEHTDVFVRNLTHLKLDLSANWDCDTIVPLLKQIGQNLKYFSLVFRSYDAKYFTGDYWSTFLSSTLNKSCKIELFIEGCNYLINDQIDIYHRSKSFETEFWYDYDLSIKLHYDPYLRTCCLYTLPYPKTYLKAKWYYERILILTPMAKMVRRQISIYDRVKSVEFTIDEYFIDYQSIFYCRNIQELIVSGSCDSNDQLKSDPFSSLVHRKSLTKLVKLNWNFPKNINIYTKQHLREILKCVPNLSSITSNHIPNSLFNIFKQEYSNINIEYFDVPSYVIDSKNIKQLMITFPNLKTLTCTVKTLGVCRKILPILLYEIKRLTYFTIRIECSCNKTKFRKLINVYLQHVQWVRNENALLVWI
ncbi:unnamed protein product [Didymodactylos carnosus]|uniref:Uncharacterized protein n=1 Tax=Didymodactylos carnosus TaxID=1234261 RepID=A0A8S2EK27_9BILA|nr:unnamed protein product [Didymodactylos carnosus]CAF4005671.1 unnamed protein product [Didymodactylos carnosus]